MSLFHFLFLFLHSGIKLSIKSHVIFLVLVLTTQPVVSWYHDIPRTSKNFRKICIFKIKYVN